MLESMVWFVMVFSAAALAAAGGMKVGRGPRWAWRSALVVAVSGLFVWAWLVRRPEVAVQLIPVGVLSRIEGVAAVPVFMLMIGIAWARSRHPRQRSVVATAAGIGLVYFVHGGLWMFQPVPTTGLALTASASPVMQSRDDTCVAAASATTLGLLGVETTEAEMAALTDTREGGGATVVRALHGLRRRLAGTGVRAELIPADYDALRSLPMPVMTPVERDPGRYHMVTLIDVGRTGLQVLDPASGFLYLDRASFEATYSGRVIVFESTGTGGVLDAQLSTVVRPALTDAGLPRR